MTRPIIRLALAALVAVPTAANAQTGEALIKKLGANHTIENITHHADKTLHYRVSWDVTQGPEKPGQLVSGFRTPANFFVMAEQEGIPRRNVHLAIIVHGTATQSLLNREAYKAATGVDNESIPLLEALNEAGVQIIVCGQALINRKVPREGLLPFVKVSNSATMARAVLAAQGYATFQ